MAKRKAANSEPDGVERPAAKRVTRSTSALVKPDPEPTPAPVVATTTRRRRRPAKDAIALPDESERPTRQSRRKQAQPTDTSSLKENDHSDSEDGTAMSDDELQLAPENTRPQLTAPKKKRVVFEAVELVARSKLKRVHDEKGKRPATPPPVVASDEDDAPEEPIAAPRKKSVLKELPSTSSIRLPTSLPESFHPCLSAQKLAILHALRSPPSIDYSAISFEADDSEDEDEPANVTSLQQLEALLSGTIARSEGNSCLLVGPAGSGKSRVCGYWNIHQPHSSHLTAFTDF